MEGLTNGNSEIFFLKIIPAIFRNRSQYEKINPIIQGLKKGPKEEAKKEDKPEDENKIVELTEEEAKIEAEKIESEKPKEEPIFANEIKQRDILTMIEDEETEVGFDEKVQNIVKSIQLFTKLILTEGIETSQGMPDIGDLFGAGTLSENSSEMGLLQTLLASG